MNTDALFLLHTQPDLQRLVAWAARHNLLTSNNNNDGDFGYTLHGLLHAAFGEQAPKPFRYLDAEQGLLAYTHLNADELTQCAALADPEVAAALGLGKTLGHSGMSVRAFPTKWATGHVLGFEVRTRPVVRESKTQSGCELDAFLVASKKASNSKKADVTNTVVDAHIEIDRNSVYVQWLKEMLLRQGGAELINAQLTRYQLLGVTRKTQKSSSDDIRRNHVVVGPDAVLTGQLCVKDSQLFAQLLSRGIGRHRAFGFGLILLRPAIS